jgi:hypothetical protein
MTDINPVVHFEMPYENRERLVKFYEKAFGWQMQKLGQEMGDTSPQLRQQQMRTG